LQGVNDAIVLMIEAPGKKTPAEPGSGATVAAGRHASIRR
jgi:hypothetical protein